MTIRVFAVASILLACLSVPHIARAQSVTVARHMDQSLRVDGAADVRDRLEQSAQRCTKVVRHPQSQRSGRHCQCLCDGQSARLRTDGRLIHAPRSDQRHYVPLLTQAGIADERLRLDASWAPIPSRPT